MANVSRAEPSAVSISVLIVDDEAPARKRLRDLLAKEADMVVVAECPDGPSAVDSIHEHEPDVLFLDVQLPEMDGFEVPTCINNTNIGTTS